MLMRRTGSASVFKGFAISSAFFFRYQPAVSRWYLVTPSHQRRPHGVFSTPFERTRGIGPPYPAWEAGTLPLSYVRTGDQERKNRESLRGFGLTFPCNLFLGHLGDALPDLRHMQGISTVP